VPASSASQSHSQLRWRLDTNGNKGCVYTGGINRI
jgi:hypothetical protein